MKFFVISRVECRGFMRSSLVIISLLCLFCSCQKEHGLLDNTPLVIAPDLKLELVSKDGSEKQGKGSQGEVAYLKIYDSQSEVDYKKLIANQSFYYEGLFKEYRTPYPGILSNTKGCPKELTGKAEISADQGHFYVWAYANRRKVVGECLKKLNEFFFEKFILRCAGSTDTYVLELYLPFAHYSSQGSVKVSCASTK